MFSDSTENRPTSSRLKNMFLEWDPLRSFTATVNAFSEIAHTFWHGSSSPVTEATLCNTVLT